MTGAPRAPRSIGSRVDVAVAVGTWVVVSAVLLASPVLTRLDGAANVAVVAHGSRDWWFCLATVTVQAVGLGRLRRRPRSALVTVAAVSLPLAAAGTGDTFSLTSAAITVAVFVVVLRHPLRGLWPALAVTAVVLVVGEVVNGLAGPLGVAPVVGAALLQAVGAVGVPLLVATALAGRRVAREAQRRELRAVAGEQEALVRVAVADERTAMARELHDIAAHHLSGIALMAAAVDRQIDTDPETAKDSVRQIRAQSTAVLTDLRRLVGLLRAEADAPRSVESLDGVRELVGQRRAGGAPIELRTWPAEGRGPGDGIGPLAQLAVYRLVQEALTNAAQHAPGAPTVVELDDRPDGALVVSVVNAPGRLVPTARRGYGLVGMAERADLLGAELHYGATVDGGWEVRLEVPRNPIGPAVSETSPQAEGAT